MEYKEVLNREAPPRTFYDAVEYVVAFLHEHHATGNIQFPDTRPPTPLREASQLLSAWLMVREPDDDPNGTVTIRGEGWSL